MRAAHKLKALDEVTELEPARGHHVEGHVVKVGPDGKAKFRNERGQIIEVRIPSQIDRRRLQAAVALAAVPGIAVQAEGMRGPVLWCTFLEPVHEALAEHVKLEGKTIELEATESLHIRAGQSTISVTAAGEIQARGKNILSRARNTNRIRGGSVRIN
jgi:hypothetical protein